MAYSRTAAPPRRGRSCRSAAAGASGRVWSGLVRLVRPVPSVDVEVRATSVSPMVVAKSRVVVGSVIPASASLARWLLMTVLAARPQRWSIWARSPDRDELDAETGGGGGDLGEVAEWGDVGGLVQHEERRRVEPAVVGGGLVGGSKDGLDQRGEQRPGPCLFVDGSGDAEGVGAAVEQPARVDLAGGGRGRDVGSARMVSAVV